MKFKAGQSGNPQGKPRGARDKRTELRELLRPHQEALIAKVVVLAKSGDPTALKIIFDRLMPPLRPRDELVQFDLTGDTLTEKACSVLIAIAGGQLTPDQGMRLLEAISTCARIQAIEDAQLRLNNDPTFSDRPLTDLTDEELMKLASPTYPDDDTTRRVSEMLSQLKAVNSTIQTIPRILPQSKFASTDDDHHKPSSEEQMRARIDALFADPDDEALAA